jgi:hypothetical protein
MVSAPVAIVACSVFDMLHPTILRLHPHHLARGRRRTIAAAKHSHFKHSKVIAIAIGTYRCTLLQLRHCHKQEGGPALAVALASQGEGE